MTECGCTVWPWMLMACSRRLAVPFPFIQPSFVHYQPNFLYAQSFIFIVRQACFECLVMTSIWPSREGNPGKKDNIWGKNNSICCVCPPLCSSSGGLVVNICGNTCTLPRAVSGRCQLHLPGGWEEVALFAQSKCDGSRVRRKLEWSSTSPVTLGTGGE